MDCAIKQSKKAYSAGEVPVGAVIVKNGKVISRAYNKRETKQNALYHAEILAIDKACKKLKNFRLDDCEMFVTLEPCPMCSGAILNARLKKVTYGASDDNLFLHCENILQDPKSEINVEVVSGEKGEQCRELLLQFFAKVRDKNKTKKMLGKQIEKSIFAFNLDNEKFEDVKKTFVCAFIEDTQKMQVLPVCTLSPKKNFGADEIFEKYSTLKAEKKRVKIVTMWGEKKYFN